MSGRRREAHLLLRRAERGGTDCARIRRLFEVEKLSRREISRRLRCCRRTVNAALGLETPVAGGKSERPSILDPYKAEIDGIIGKHPYLSAVRVREEVGKRGYWGERCRLILFNHNLGA